jgi:hypothetical protein
MWNVFYALCCAPLLFKIATRGDSVDGHFSQYSSTFILLETAHIYYFTQKRKSKALVLFEWKAKRIGAHDTAMTVYIHVDISRSYHKNEIILGLGNKTETVDVVRGSDIVNRYTPFVDGQ